MTQHEKNVLQDLEDRIDVLSCVVALLADRLLQRDMDVNEELKNKVDTLRTDVGTVAQL